MDSMTHSHGAVIGVDAHTDTHDVAVLDDCGRLLARQTFAADAAGYRALREWIETFAPIAAIGVESTGSYAAGLVRYLRTDGLEVLEVNQPHPHTRRRRGKSDPNRRRTGRPPRVGRQPAGRRQGHQRDRRGDPPAAGRT